MPPNRTQTKDNAMSLMFAGLIVFFAALGACAFWLLPSAEQIEADDWKMAEALERRQRHGAD